MPLITSPRATDGRANHLLARIRTKQLETALHGRVIDSARYARRAERIRQAQLQPATRN